MFGKHFLLDSPHAAELYEQHAKNAPIYDYHCHLSAQDIFEDRVFGDISSLWLGGDHYKWRAMRFAGVPEAYITGGASSYEKFERWAAVCERLAGCPLYHWSNMELAAYFGAKQPLSVQNARQVYDRCNAVIREKSLSPQKLIQSSGVRLICTTDDPVDDLQWHQKLKEGGAPFLVLPTFRPDRLLAVEQGRPWREYLQALGQAAGVSIKSYDDMKRAAAARMDHFAANGCRISDHSLSGLAPCEISESRAQQVFDAALAGQAPGAGEANAFRAAVLCFLGGEYHRRGWVMQLHVGALRNVSRRQAAALGPDAGFDIMDDFRVVNALNAILDELDFRQALPKTILYNLNAKDTQPLCLLAQSYADGSVAGRVQFGAPWWHLDCRGGIEAHLETLGNAGMLPYFVGMLTDSRSYLSYVRHDYFRRVLCNFVGGLMQRGEYLGGPEAAGRLVADICSNNIAAYLGLNTERST